MTEHEKALFRVYDRAMEPLRHDIPCSHRHPSLKPTRICMGFQYALLMSAAIFALLLGYLHLNFVNVAGCLEGSLAIAADGAGLLIPPAPAPEMEGITADAAAVGEATPALNNSSNSTDANYITLSSGKRISSDLVIGIHIGNRTQDTYAAAVASGEVNATDFEAHYMFTGNPVVLFLGEKLRREHNFKSLNVSLEENECWGGDFTRSLLSLTGYDTPVINMFMFTFHSRGMLINTESQAEWFWSSTSIPPRDGWGLLDRLSFKVGVATQSVLAFVLVTTVTALVVRILLSSGVVVMFPFLLCLERLPRGIDFHLLSASYPWLGMPMERLRRQGKPLTPFIMGHVMQVLVFYGMYNACQLAWAMWLYDKTMSPSMEIWLYGMVMLWDYFSVIFVRANLSIKFFPKWSALLFLNYHFYYYCFPYPFINLAACLHMTLLAHAMMWTVHHLELPGLLRGEIGQDHPRAYYVELPWPAWSAALPPAWTVFVPPNARVHGIYDEDVVPPRRPEGAGSATAAAQAADDDEDTVNDELRPLRRRSPSMDLESA
ncbi:unnamed protein product [Chrysoparadoxa australica]